MLACPPYAAVVRRCPLGNRPGIASDNTIIWLARPEVGDDTYIAVFNISDVRETIHYDWKDLGLTANSYSMRDLWLRKNLHSATSLDVTLEPHASVLFQASVGQNRQGSE
jgi:hypothetical protein